MGERELAPVKAKKAIAAACHEAMDAKVEPSDEAMRVQTPGGMFWVRWDARGCATALGQMAFFAEYLEATGLFEGGGGAARRAIRARTRPNAPEQVDLLGTLSMITNLDGGMPCGDHVR